MGRYKEALEDANKAIELNPDELFNYSLKAHLFFGLCENDKAM